MKPSDQHIPMIGQGDRKYAELEDIIFEPMPGKVVAEVIGDDEFFDDSRLLIRPQTIKIPRTTARVIAIYEPFLLDDGVTESKPYVAVGDLIIFGVMSGTSIKLGNKQCVVIRETEILTKFRNATKAQIDTAGVVRGEFDDLDEG
jgi:co-chaperonin GroES (HSP10)